LSEACKQLLYSAGLSSDCRIVFYPSTRLPVTKASAPFFAFTAARIGWLVRHTLALVFPNSRQPSGNKLAPPQFQRVQEISP